MSCSRAPQTLIYAVLDRAEPEHPDHVEHMIHSVKMGTVTSSPVTMLDLRCRAASSRTVASRSRSRPNTGSSTTGSADLRHCRLVSRHHRLGARSELRRLSRRVASGSETRQAYSFPVAATARRASDAGSIRSLDQRAVRKVR